MKGTRAWHDLLNTTRAGVFFFFFFYAFDEGWIGAWARKPASCPVSFTLAGAARGHDPTIGSLDLDCIYFFFY